MVDPFNIINTFFPSLGKSVGMLGNSITPKNNYHDLASLAPLVTAGYLLEDFYYWLAKTQGYDKKYAQIILDSATQRLNPIDLTNAFHRGFISEHLLDVGLKLTSYGERERELLKQLSFIQPPVNDVIRFAVREVYTPDIVEKYQLMSDIPEKYLIEAKKTGLQEDQARNYWASHWELPSLSMGFEMFHRQTKNPDPNLSDTIKTPLGNSTHNVIGKDTLKELVKSLDISPFWRDKLIEISYTPLTRVDVRRMYGLGVLDQDGVFRNYLDQGYTPENAKLMTDFTVKYESNEYDGITRASLIASYADGIITYEQLELYLRGLGYTEQNVMLWLAQAQYDKVMADIKVMSDDIVELYQMGAYNLDQVRAELLKLDVPAIYVETVITKVIKVKAKRTKVPTLDDCKSWLKNGLIDESYFTGKLRLLGYKDQDIQIYLTEIAQNRDTSIVKYLSESVYVRWLKQGIMTAAEFVETLIKKGLTEADINKLILELEDKENGDNK
ncbi:MAG: hypothetical protein PHI02_09420 [Sulfurovaceae bacterium]|nr:hypothetical protein [Sulfurovaceae bacterium]